MTIITTQVLRTLQQLTQSQLTPVLTGVSYLPPESEFFTQGLEQFLASSKTSLLLLGDAGSGKTLFCYYLMQQLLEAQSEFIPIYVPIKPGIDYQQPVIEPYFIELGLTQAQINELKAHAKLLFIFDGYGQTGQYVNLHVTQQLREWQCKVLITCRPQYLMHSHDYSIYFAPVKGQRKQAHLLQALKLPALTSSQVSRYLQQAMPIAQVWQEDSVLQSLMANPLLLNLMTKLSLSQDKPIAEVYQQLLTAWFSWQEQKYKALGLLAKEESIIESCWAYHQAMAKELKAQQLTSFTHRPRSKLFSAAENSWEQYFSQEPRITLLRHASLLMQVGEYRYGFIAADLIDYFAAKVETRVQPFMGVSRPELMKPANTAPTASSTHHPLCQRNMVQETGILRVLADRVSENPAFKDQLFKLVEASRQDEGMAVAAANAITVLNLARVSFAGRDLAKIRIPGANLAQANFDHADLSHADLTGVNLRNACLRNANLSYSQMAQIDFGFNQVPGLELPSFLPMPGSSVQDQMNCQLVYNSQRKILAIQLQAKINLWDIAQAKLWAEILPKSIKEIETICVAPNGKWLVIAGNAIIEVWDIESKELKIKNRYSGKHDFKSYSSADKKISIDAESQVLAIKLRYEKEHLEPAETVVEIWDLFTGKLTSKLNKKQLAKSERFEFFATGQILVAADSDWNPERNGAYYTKIKFFDVNSKKEIGQPLIFSPKQEVKDFIFAENGHYIIAITFNGEVVIANKYDHLDYRLKHTIKTDNTSLNLSNIVLHAQQNLLAVSRGEVIQLYSLATGQLQQEWRGHQGDINALAFNFAGNLLASGGEDHNIILWEVGQEKPLSVFYTHQSPIEFLKFTDEDDRLLSVDSSANHYVSNSGKSNASASVSGHTGAIRSVGFEIQSQVITTYGEDNRICQWNGANGQLIRVFNLPAQAITNASLNSTGQYFIYSQQQTLQLWDVKEGKLQQSYNLAEPITSCEFSATGAYIGVIANARGYLLDIQNQAIEQLDTNQLPVAKLCFSPCEQWVAIIVGERQETVQVIDLLTKKQTNSFSITDDKFTALSFNPTSTCLAVGSEKGHIYQWDLKTTERVTAIKNAKDKVIEIYFSPDGHYLCYIIQEEWHRNLIVFDLEKRLQVIHTYLTTGDWDSASDLLVCGGHIMVRGTGFELVIAYGSLKQNIELQLFAKGLHHLTVVKFITNNLLLIADKNGDLKTWRYQTGPLRKQWRIEWSHNSGLDVEDAILNEVSGLAESSKAMLLSPAFKAKPYGYTAMHQAAAQGNVQQIRYLAETDKRTVDTKGGHDDLPLHIAIENSHFEAVVALLEHGANKEARARDEQTALHVAAYYNRIEVARYLLQCGGNINAQDSSGKTPLHIAIARGYVDMAELLLQNGADKEARDNKQTTPLHLSVNKNQESIFNLLLAYGCKVDVCQADNSSILHSAVMVENLTIIRVLLEKGCPVNIVDNYNKWAPIHFAAESGNDDVLPLLLAYNPNIEIKDNFSRTPLHHATGSGQLTNVKLLIKHGANIIAQDTVGNYTPIYLAVEKGHGAVLKFLLEHEVYASPSIQLVIDLFNAYTQSVGQKTRAKYQNYDVFKLLLATAAKTQLTVNQWQGWLKKLINLAWAEELELALEHMARNDFLAKQSLPVLTFLILQREFLEYRQDRKSYQERIFRLILKYGLDIHQPFKFYNIEYTIADEIISSGINLNLIKCLFELKVDLNIQWPDIIGEVYKQPIRLTGLETLKEHGVNFELELKNAKGQTALHIAVEKIDIVATQWLLAKDADPNARDLNLATPLHLLTQLKPYVEAKHEKRLAIAKLLKQYGAGLDVRDVNCATALHSAAQSNYSAMAEWLSQQGADKEAVDKEGLTPFLLAVKKGNTEIMRLLYQAGANTQARTGANCPEGEGLTAFQLAVINYPNIAFNNHGALVSLPKPILCLFTDCGFDINQQDERGYTPLHQAVQLANWKNGFNEALIVVLVNQGASLVIYDNEGLTPFLLAVKLGKEKVVQLLLKKEFKYGLTSLESGTSREIVKRMAVDEDTDIYAKTAKNCPYGEGLAAIHLIAICFDEKQFNYARDTLEVLRENGYSIDEQDEAGRTILHHIIQLAAQKNQLRKSLLTWVFSCGPNALIRDKAGYTPFEYVILANRVDLVKELLLSASVKPVVIHDGSNSLKLAMQQAQVIASVSNYSSADLTRVLQIIDEIQVRNPIEDIANYLLLARFYMQLAEDAKNYFRQTDQKALQNKAQNSLYGAMNAMSSCPKAEVYTNFAYFSYKWGHYYNVKSFGQQAIQLTTDNSDISFKGSERNILCHELQAELDFWGELTINARGLAFFLMLKASKEFYASRVEIQSLLQDFAQLAAEQAQPILYVLLGHSYRTYKQNEEAAKAYKDAIDCYQGTIAMPKYLTAEQCYLALQDMPENKAQRERLQALEELSALIVQAPHEPDYLVSRARIYLQLGNSDRAIADITQALSLDPTNAALYLYSGDTYGAIGNYKKAIEDFTSLIKLEPNNAEAYSRRGYYKSLMGLYEMALADLLAALEISPRLGSALMHCALVCAMFDEQKLAAQYIKEASSQVNTADLITKAAVNYNHAFVCFLNSDYLSASTYISIAIQNYPHKTDVIYFEYSTLQALIKLHLPYGLIQAGNELAALVNAQPTVLTYALYGCTSAMCGKLDVAQECLRKISNINSSKYPDLNYFWQGRLKFFLGDIDGAFADIAQAININPKNICFYITRAELAMQTQREEQALADLTYLIRRHPENEAWKQVRQDIQQKIAKQAAQASDQSSKFSNELAEDEEGLVDFNVETQLPMQAFNEVLHKLGQIIKPVTDSVIAWINQGNEFHYNGKHDQAIDCYTKAIKFAPNSAKLWSNRAEIWAAKRNYNQAIVDISKTIELEPSNHLHWNKRGNYRYAIYLHDDALADFNKAIELAPNQVPGWVNRASIWITQGKVDKAIADISRAIKLEPDNELWWYKRGCLWFKIGQFEEAIVDLTQVTTLNPDVADYWNECGLVWLAKGEYTNAVANFTKAIVLVFDEPSYYINRAEAWFANGKYDKALTDIEHAIELDPSNAELYSRKAEVFNNVGDLDNAIKAYSKAIELDQGNSDYWYQRGWIRIEKKEYAAAQADMEHIVRLEPEHGVNLVTLAYTELFQNNIAKARQYFEQILNRVTGHESEERAKYYARCGLCYADWLQQLTIPAGDLETIQQAWDAMVITNRKSYVCQVLIIIITQLASHCNSATWQVAAEFALSLVQQTQVLAPNAALERFQQYLQQAVQANSTIGSARISQNFTLFRQRDRSSQEREREQTAENGNLRALTMQ